MAIAITELTEIVKYRTSLTRKQAKEAVEAVITTIQAELQAGGTVHLTGFGTFRVHQMPTKEIGDINVAGKRKLIPATKVVKFVQGSYLRAAVRGAA